MSVTEIYHIMSLSMLYQNHKKSDMSVSVIYHAMSFSILYQYHSEE